MSDDIVSELRWMSENAREQGATDAVNCLRNAAEDIERLRAERNELRRENAALRAEIERYRIQSVQLMDLQRLLEVQDRQLECAQRALQILEGANGGDAKAQGCGGGTRSLSGPLGSRDVG